MARGQHPVAMVSLKKITFIAFACLLSGAFAQRSDISGRIVRAVDDKVFKSCDQVEQIAQGLQRETRDRVFIAELFPKSRGSLFTTFVSDTGRTQALVWWMSRGRSQSSPFALFYSVNGAYTLRCRDDEGRFSELTGPEGNPLQLKLASGNAKILHFYFTPINVVHVFVIAEVPLETIDGKRLMADIQARLGARFIFLCVRNDPWFFSYSSDNLPFVFIDSPDNIAEKQYRAGRTLACSTIQRCSVLSEAK
jgi:hypothetical protein